MIFFFVRRVLPTPNIEGKSAMPPNPHSPKHSLPLPCFNRSADVCPQCVTTVTRCYLPASGTEKLLWKSLTLWDPYLKGSQQYHSSAPSLPPPPPPPHLSSPVSAVEYAYVSPDQTRKTKSVNRFMKRCTDEQYVSHYIHTNVWILIHVSRVQLCVVSSVNSVTVWINDYRDSYRAFFFFLF